MTLTTLPFSSARFTLHSVGRDNQWSQSSREVLVSYKRPLARWLFQKPLAEAGQRRLFSRAMSPSFLNFKELRRRSKASFRTERSTDESSVSSHNTTPTSGSTPGSTPTDGSPPTSGSSTPPSIRAQSDLALNLQSQDQPQPQPAAISRPNPRPNGGSNRYSVSGMVGLGSPGPDGKGPVLPVSVFSPRITNVSEGQWVSDA